MATVPTISLSNVLIEWPVQSARSTNQRARHKPSCWKARLTYNICSRKFRSVKKNELLSRMGSVQWKDSACNSRMCLHQQGLRQSNLQQGIRKRKPLFLWSEYAENVKVSEP